MPGSLERASTIEARYRGPGIERMRSQLDALIESIRFGPPPEEEEAPDDCGPPFAPPVAVGG